MTIQQLICRAASTYPDAYPLQYFDLDRGEPKLNPFGGDTLAQFVAQELADTYDQDASDEEQIATAVRVMQSAADDLQAVANSLGDMVLERRAA